MRLVMVDTEGGNEKSGEEDFLPDEIEVLLDRMEAEREHPDRARVRRFFQHLYDRAGDLTEGVTELEKGDIRIIEAMVEAALVLDEPRRLLESRTRLCWAMWKFDEDAKAMAVLPGLLRDFDRHFLPHAPRAFHEDPFGAVDRVVSEWAHEREGQELQAVAFSYFLALYLYRGVAGGLRNFPEISNDAIAAIQEDFFSRTGLELRYPYTRVEFALDDAVYFQRRDEEARLFVERETLQPGLIDGCGVCLRGKRIGSLVRLGRLEQAIEETEALLRGGESCGSVPGRPLARLLIPLLEAGDRERAKRYHREAVERSRKGGEALEDLALLTEHVIYLAVEGPEERAAEFARASFSRLEGRFSGTTKFHGLLAFWTWLVLRPGAIPGERGVEARPAQIDWVEAQRRWRTREIGDEALLLPVEAGLRELVERFDHRDGIPVHSRMWQEHVNVLRRLRPDRRVTLPDLPPWKGEPFREI